MPHVIYEMITHICLCNICMYVSTITFYITVKRMV